VPDKSGFNRYHSIEIHIRWFPLFDMASNAENYFSVGSDDRKPGLPGAVERTERLSRAKRRISSGRAFVKDDKSYNSEILFSRG
jgi:hypothetical protein